MKKIIAVTAALSVLAGASAFAKTEGSYLGLDLHRAVATSTINNKTTPNDPSLFTNHLETSKTNIGISYKYAFNFDKFFVAPGVFYERIGTKQYNGSQDQGFTPFYSLKNRYGARADFGYDITDNFAAYVTAGIANTGTKVSLADGHGAEGQSYGIQTTKTKTGVLWGVGVLSKINDQISLGFEFNTQRLDLKNNDQQSNIHTKVNLDMYKVTLAYHF